MQEEVAKSPISCPEVHKMNFAGKDNALGLANPRKTKDLNIIKIMNVKPLPNEPIIAQAGKRNPRDT
jgi:hypothetical protein